MNAVKHGCCAARFSAKSPVLPGENEAYWREVEAGWFAEYEPETSVSRALVGEAALAFWQLARNRRRLEQVNRGLAEKDPLAWTDQDHGNYSRFLRYKTAGERSFSTAFKNLEYLRKARITEAEALRRVERQLEDTCLKICRDSAELELEHARLLSEQRKLAGLNGTPDSPSTAEDSELPSSLIHYRNLIENALRPQDEQHEPPKPPDR